MRKGLIAALATIVLLRPVGGVASEGGWVSTELTVANISDEQTLSCQFLLAHWFEISLGPLAPGESETRQLAVRPHTGDVAIVNEVGDHMAVERLTCGRTAGDRTTWIDPPVDRIRRGDGTITLGCRLADTRADCRFD